jgi:NAD(P)-dependent dehydrogenase (short-subunit alcohol dehydrogenase family)
MSTFKQLSDLTGRTALITGAVGGLGKVFADTLGEMGANLILVDLPGKSLGIFAEEVKRKWGTKVGFFEINLEVDADRQVLITKIKKDFDQLNILINNAAFVGNSDLTGWNTDFENQSLESWRRAFEVNLTAVFELCQGFTPLMKKSVGASIINISSIYGQFGPDWRLYEGTNIGNPAAYGASKGGIIQFTKWLSTTLAPSIRANVVCPGGIFRNQPQEFVDRYQKRTPLGRMATENDLKGALGYLASDLSSYVTGQILNVDGGWGAW